MIDNNIIQSLGVGSGIDTRGLVDQLVEIEQIAPQQRIDSKKELTETRISDFGLLSNALSTLQDAASALTDPEALFSKSASFTESNALVPLELDTDVQPGSYAFNVSQIAQSQTLAYSGFPDADATVGEGTLTFSFGNYARTEGVIDGPLTINADKPSVELTIDSTNNTLEGIRDAINDADMGVTASIIFDGNEYNLSVVSESGADNEVQIGVVEGGVAGLSALQFDESNFAAEAQAGQNSIVSLNGISNIERSSNTIDDIVEGLTLDVLQTMQPNETVIITVTEDKAFAEDNIRNFVDSYNAFLEAVDPVFGTNQIEDEEGETQTVQGSLANDALAKSLLSQIRSVIASSIPGLETSNFTSLTNLGIRTELDGTISIDEKDFTNAFENNFEDVQKLLAPFNDSSSDDVTINSFGDNTVAGSYDVEITSNPTQGVYNGAAFTGDLDTTGEVYTFVVDVNGTTSETITIPTDTFADESALAAQIQSLINGDTNLSEAGAAVNVTFNGTGFDITSASFGTSSNVRISEPSADTSALLGLVDGAGTPGTSAAGTIDGVAGFGSSNVLLPALGEPGESLALLIGENATTATVNFSRGFAGELERLIDSFLDSSGVIATRTETLETNLDTFEAEQERLDRRIGAFEERLLNQFIAMERILSSLDTSGSFLDNLIDTLPFTSGQGR